LLESIAFSGLALNLVVYLATVLHGSTAFNAAHVDTWNGTTFIVPVIGAFLADSYWGKYRTILASIAFYLVVSPRHFFFCIFPFLRHSMAVATLDF
jgi:solute carrier family 15 (peptide/histidine transporter), member 3/4